MAITDDSLFPFGMHKGKKMANVPEQGKCFGELKAYIEDNADSLKIYIKK